MVLHVFTTVASLHQKVSTKKGYFTHYRSLVNIPFLDFCRSKSFFLRTPLPEGNTWQVLGTIGNPKILTFTRWILNNIDTHGIAGPYSLTWFKAPYNSSCVKSLFLGPFPFPSPCHSVEQTTHHSSGYQRGHHLQLILVLVFCHILCCDNTLEAAAPRPGDEVCT